MPSSVNQAAAHKYTPALGVAYLTPLYDFAIAWLTRESSWRNELVNAVNPKSGDRILDVGCGTGTLALRLKASSKETTVIGIDPDPEVLRRAAAKAAANSLSVEWKEGFLSTEFIEGIRPISKVVSSLVFHQIPELEKRRVLDCIFQSLEPGGYLYIADYGKQRSRLMRCLFRLTVQILDGVEDTTPNAQGKLPEFIEGSGLKNVEEIHAISTLTGSISIYRGQKPMKGITNENY